MTAAPDLFEVDRGLARLDDAGIEIVRAMGELLGSAGERPDSEWT